MRIVPRPSGPEVSAQDLTEDEEAEAVDEDIVDDVTAEDEDDEAEVEDDENTELVSRLWFDVCGAAEFSTEFYLRNSLTLTGVHEGVTLCNRGTTWTEVGVCVSVDGR